MLKFSMTLAFPIRRSLNPRIACRNWPPETSLFATPAAIPQTRENKTTLSPAFVTLTFASSISPVFAALTKNTGVGYPPQPTPPCVHAGIPATPVPSIVYLQLPYTTGRGYRLPSNCSTPASSAIIDGLTNAAISASAAQ
jgi:hypothetical protein